MLILRYTILALVLLNLPSMALITIDSTVSNLVSLATFGLLVVYFMLNSKGSLNLWLIVLGVLYFSVSSLVSQEYFPLRDRDFYVFVIKYFILVICGYELVKRTSAKEMLLFILIGACSILLQLFVLDQTITGSGRLSGFYLNPNKAGYICITGYALSYALKEKKIKIGAQIIFTFLGLLTFSRTFLVIWVLINLISLKIDVKNVRVFVYGFVLLFALIAFGEYVSFQTDRLTEIDALVGGGNTKAQELTSDSRTDTWALYYDVIFENMVFGNGYNALGGRTSINRTGVHNSYLKVLGEAGIFVFIFFMAMIISILINTYRKFNEKPYLFMVAVCLVLYLTTTHNFFDLEYILFITMWLQAQVKESEVREIDVPQFRGIVS